LSAEAVAIIVGILTPVCIAKTPNRYSKMRSLSFYDRALYG